MVRASSSNRRITSSSRRARGESTFRAQTTAEAQVLGQMARRRRPVPRARALGSAPRRRRRQEPTPCDAVVGHLEASAPPPRSSASLNGDPTTSARRALTNCAAPSTDALERLRIGETIESPATIASRTERPAMKPRNKSRVGSERKAMLMLSRGERGRLRCRLRLNPFAVEPNVSPPLPLPSMPSTPKGNVGPGRRVPLRRDRRLRPPQPATERRTRPAPRSSCCS